MIPVGVSSDRDYVYPQGNRYLKMMDFLESLDWSPLIISLKTGVVATIICFFLGMYAARKVIKLSYKAKAVVDGILTLPMVFPPTVAGFILLLIFSRRRPIGIFLDQQLDIQVVHTWLGCILAATVIAFPLMYRNARAAFEQIDANLVYAGRTLGMSEMNIFWKIVVPTAGPGIASGTILTFARAMGEYGATSMLAGNIPGKTGTVSQRIAMVIQDGDFATAGFWVVVVLLISFGIIFLVNMVTGSRMKNIRRW
jgi:molybdate ABC transporter, permease protein